MDWKVLGPAMACTLALGYVSCVSFDLLFDKTMYRAWVDLLPGFEWISVGAFALGLLEVVVYGIFFGLVFAPLHNLFSKLQAGRAA